MERTREGWREPTSAREGQRMLERTRESWRRQRKVKESQKV